MSTMENKMIKMHIHGKWIEYSKRNTKLGSQFILSGDNNGRLIYSKSNPNNKIYQENCDYSDRKVKKFNIIAKGPGGSMFQEKYEYNGMSIITSSITSEDEDICKRICKYDMKGYPVEKKVYLKGKLIMSETFYYDKNNILGGSDKVFYNDINEMILEVNKNYDNGKKTREDKLSSYITEDEIKTYHPNGNLKTKNVIIYYQDNDKMRSTEKHYSKEGRLMRKIATSYGVRNRELGSVSYTLDTNGRISEREFSAGENKLYQEKYKRDRNILWRTVFIGGQFVFSEMTYTT